jgi:hypothetical protein
MNDNAGGAVLKLRHFSGLFIIVNGRKFREASRQRWKLTLPVH